MGGIRVPRDPRAALAVELVALCAVLIMDLWHVRVGEDALHTVESVLTGHESAGYVGYYLVTGVAAGDLRHGLLTPALGLVLALIAVARRRDLTFATLGALALSLGVGVGWVVTVLAEPRLMLYEPIFLGYTKALAIGLLVAAGVRRWSVLPAAAVAVAGGAALLAAPGLRHWNDVIPLSAQLGWAVEGWWPAVVVPVVVGLWLRRADRRHRAATAEARTGERMELARELHDVVAHDVTGIIMYAQAAQLGGTDDPQRLLHAMAQIERAGRDALDSMRRVVAVLRSSDEAQRSPEPELADVARLAERFTATGAPVRLVLPPPPHVPLPAGVGATVYRVVQESLTNARKHAPRLAGVELTVVRGEDWLDLSVRNDGVAAPRRAGAGFGLVGMAERVRALGGALHSGPDGPGHWLVRARLPLGAVGGTAP
jgi:signal transduction histidine kinase